jgi:hypothetical protein
MKRALATLTVLAAIAALSTTCFAQTAGPTGTAGTLQATGAKKKGAPNFKLLLAGLKEIEPSLNLSKTQQGQLDDLSKKTQDSFDQIRKETKGDKDARNAKLKDLGESYEKDLNGILSADQQKQYRSAYKAYVKKWHEDHKKGTPTPGTTTTPATSPSTSGSGK